MEPLDPDNRDLTAQMQQAVDGVHVDPDLPAVMAGAAQRRRRGRSLSLGGAAAVVALGVGGVIMVSNRDTDELPAAQPDPVVVPLTTLAPGTETAQTDPDAEPPTTEPFDVEVPVSTISLGDDARTDSNLPDPNAPDPADEFLDQTDEIYRREMPSGYDLQIRQSTLAYGELFGIDWDLPTGSQQACLGNPAVFIGDPSAARERLSSWSVQQWWPIDDTNDFQVSEHYGGGDAASVIIRTDLDGVEAAIMQDDVLFDSTAFVDGIAVLGLPGFDSDTYDENFDPMLSIATRGTDGVVDVQNLPLYSAEYGNRTIPEGCQGPPFPGSTLPEPGVEQPDDPLSAELSIRDRHAILVDQSIVDKPEDLLTNDTGVDEARAQMEAGEFAESAAGAEYTIDDVVFTDAETAWFQYGIVAPTGTFGQRFGQAIFNGEVWQITRQTICQDLSLAGGQCDVGGTPNLQPPIAGGLDRDAALNAWYQVNEQYQFKLDCTPINPCGEFDLTKQLPDPGEQPDNADAARNEVIEVMESMYGSGALLERLDRIDDSTGVAEAVESLGDGGYGDEADSATVAVQDVVFTEPDVALFLYTLTTDGYTFTDRPGAAFEIDGVWRISRRTVCSDLSLAGATCDP